MLIALKNDGGGRRKEDILLKMKRSVTFQRLSKEILKGTS